MTFMTTNTVGTASTSGLMVWLGKFFTGLNQGLVASMESRSRLSEIAALNAKSDAELKEMGIERDEIPRHVFRNVFFL